MPHAFSRSELLLGREAMAALADARVAVFGLGGVGSYAAEALARSGVGALDLVDDDRVCLTNLNRQLIATHASLGQLKAEVMGRRVLDINPRCRVTVLPCFYSAETADSLPLAPYNYVVDAIDTVSSKLLLARRAAAAGVPLISCMGAGNKLDPTRFEVADIYETSVCPLARVMRRELRALGIPALKVVYSKEPPRQPLTETASLEDFPPAEDLPPPEDEPPTDSRPGEPGRRQTPGSVAFVPGVAGLILAGEVVRDLIALAEKKPSGGSGNAL